MDDKNIQARNLLVQGALDEINEMPSYANFKSHVYYVLAKLGLHMKATEEGLFAGEDWYKSDCKEELLKTIQAFMKIHIR